MQDYDWDSRYQERVAPPWDSDAPAPELEEFWRAEYPQSSMPACGRVLEIGCGTGSNAVWLAKQGCSVTAIEISKTALELAKQRASREAISIDWQMSDICETRPVAENSQDFAFDCSVYNVIPHARRPLFVANLASSLKRGALWLSLVGCKDEHRENPEQGPPQMSAVELLQYTEPLFELLRLHRTRFVIADGRQYLAWNALFRKR